ncbi:MAG: CRISPR-associated helicase Cas3' [Nitrososphaeria archaeon]
MDLLDALRAKSYDEGDYLLKDHLCATIERAVQLKEFIDKNRSFISYNFSEEFFKNLYVACLLHDLGKIHYGFQRKVFKNKTDGKDGERWTTILGFFDGYRDININDHEIISIIYSLIFLDNSEWDKKIRTAVLLHHYNDFYVDKQPNFRLILDDNEDLVKYINFLIEKWKDIENLLKSLLQYIKQQINENEVKELLGELENKLRNGLPRIKELYKAIENRYGVSKVLQLFEMQDKDTDDSINFFVFLGALRRCDYSASAAIDIEERSTTLCAIYSSLKSKIKNVISGTLWQEEVLKRIDDKGNLVLIAPTGSGKTEFALMWAGNKGRKLIYTLPLRVALNDMYWRLGDKKSGYFDTTHLSILHSTSFIEYVKANEYFKSYANEYHMLDVGTKQNIAKQFSSPIILTTPDQVFLTSLKYYGFDKLLNIYPLSTIVIDEIQAYNPEMVAIVIKTIDIIKKLGGNIIIITATFPPYLEEFLKDREFTILDVKDYVNGQTKIKNYELRRHLIKILDKPLIPGNNQKELEGLNDIIKILNENRDKNILLVVNTVGKAIKLYKELGNQLKGEKDTLLYLLHARLLEKEKDRRISEIKERINEIKKGENEKHGRIVLVSTQILEASVDLDFDILMTEISPIDSQIQRWGRVYRNRQNDYNSNVPNIYIFSEYDGATTKIYDKECIEKTGKVLKNKTDRCLSYNDELCIIREVYDEKDNDVTLKERYVKEIKENLGYFDYISVEKKSQAQRLFRAIMGLQVIVLGAMKHSSDRITQMFAEIIEKGGDQPWSKIVSEIVNSIKRKMPDYNLDVSLDEWKLKSLLYEYSVNLPFYLIEKLGRARFALREFKGYYYIEIANDGKVCDVLKYGIDVILDEDKSYENEYEDMDNVI